MGAENLWGTGRGRRKAAGKGPLFLGGSGGGRGGFVERKGEAWRRVRGR